MKSFFLAVCKRTATAGVLFSLLTGVTGEARTPAGISPREPSEAYLALVRGDEARDGGDREAAIAAFEEAKARYQRIAEAHPEWESDIVQYRILYCDNQIRMMREKMGLPDEDFADLDDGEMGAILPAEGADPDVSPDEAEILYRDRYLAMLQENEYLRQRLTEVTDSGEELDVDPLRAGEAVPDSLPAAALSSIAEAEARVREMEQQVQALTQELVARAAKSEVVLAGPAEAPHRLETQYQKWMHDALTRESARDLKGALALYDRLLGKYPADVPAVKGQARCLIAGGSPDKAVRFLTKHAADMRDPEIAVLLGTAYGAMGRFQDSASAVELLVRDNPWNARARAIYGAALLGMGEKEAARAELEKTLDLDPELPETLYNLAWVLSDGTPSDRENAREYYRRSLELGGSPDGALEGQLAEP